MNEQQIIDRARGAYTDAPGSAVDVDGIVRAGQRRRRRRNLGTAAGAAALVTVLAGGAVGLTTLDGSGAPTTAAPAPGGVELDLHLDQVGRLGVIRPGHGDEALGLALELIDVLAVGPVY